MGNSYCKRDIKYWIERLYNKNMQDYEDVKKEFKEDNYFERMAFPLKDEQVEKPTTENKQEQLDFNFVKEWKKYHNLDTQSLGSKNQNQSNQLGAFQNYQFTGQNSLSGYYNYPYQNYCPHCGRCSHCGR